jgi:hypothetical protein
VIRVQHRAVVLSAIIMAAGCGDAPQPALTEEDRAGMVRQEEAFRRQSREFDRQTEESDRHLEKLREQDARYDALLGRWEAQADRFDAVLEALEK